MTRILRFVLLIALVYAPSALAEDDHGHDHDSEQAHDDGHAHEGEHSDEHGDDVVRVSPEVMQEFGIELVSVQAGSIGSEVRLPGEVVYNADRIAHVTPAVSGIVRRVNVSVGDHVKAGDVLAVLSSREVAAARSEYLAAKARLALARETMERDRRLYEQKVGTERSLLESRQQVREAEIAQQQAENSLHALGYSHAQIEAVASLADTDFTHYELVAPLAGVVTQRHLTIGEVVEPTDPSAPFVVADLSTVWVNLTVYQRDLAHVAPGQSVAIDFGHGIPDAAGMVAFVSPALDETTRTATARLVIDNPDGQWRPGLFMTGRLEIDRATAAVVVPRSALTEVEGRTVVFVRTAEGFEPRPVQIGRATHQSVEIADGLAVGEAIAASNVLALKAEMNRAALEHAGHAH